MIKHCRKCGALSDPYTMCVTCRRTRGKEEITRAFRDVIAAHIAARDLDALRVMLDNADRHPKHRQHILDAISLIEHCEE